MLPEAKTGGPLLRMARQFHNPLIYVLIAAGVVTLILGENIESGVIFGVVAINAIIGYIQESKAEAALDALRAMVQTEAQRPAWWTGAGGPVGPARPRRCRVDRSR